MVGVYTGTDKGNANLTIQDGTNSTSVYAYGVNTIQVSAGTLTNDGNGKVSITTGGGGGGGTISGTIISPQVAYGTANDEIGGDGNFTWDSTNELLTASFGKIKNIYEVYADVDIDKGEAVYITGYNSGSGKPQVGLAKANSSATMPSIGLATANITAGQQGFVIFSGQINGVDTAGTTANDTLYVSATTAGALTSTKPTGPTDEIQNVGRVVQVGASGKIAVSNIGRTNDVPNTISITGTLGVGGLASLDGGIDVDGAFTVADTSGNISTTGTLGVGGLASLDGGIDVDGAFTVANTNGNISTTGTLGVSGLASLDGGIDVDGAFTVADTSGNISTTGDISALAGTISGNTIQVGAGELQLTVDTFNAVIENTTQDNDILFRINNGGTTANLMTIDASESRVIIDGEGQIKKANVITLGGTPITYATHAGAYLNVSVPIELPAISSVGEQYVLVNNSGGPLSLIATGGDTIIGSTTLSDQSAMTVFALGATEWFVIG